jgi:hypothetical protein
LFSTTIPNRIGSGATLAAPDQSLLCYSPALLTISASLHAANITGISVRANPHASLYVHLFDQAAEPEPYARDADVMRLGIERFVRVIPLLFQEGVYAQWNPAARALAHEADPEVRAAVARLAREVLALLAEAEGKGGSSG